MVDQTAQKKKAVTLSILCNNMPFGNTHYVMTACKESCLMKTQFPTFTLLRYICPDIVRDKSVCSSSEHVTCKAQSETDRFHQTLFLHKPHRNALDCRQYACTQNDRRASELLPKPCRRENAYV